VDEEEVEGPPLVKGVENEVVDNVVEEFEPPKERIVPMLPTGSLGVERRSPDIPVRTDDMRACPLR